MSTFVTHAFVGAAAATAIASRGAPLRLWGLAMLCAMAPDADVLMFKFDVPYEHAWGHRGAFHGLPIALLAGFVVPTVFLRRFAPFGRRRWWGLVLFFFLVTASHGLVDAATDGGHGVGFLAPFDERRFFLPWQPLPVPNIGLHMPDAHFWWGEVRGVWIPVAIALVAWLLVRRLRGPNLELSMERGGQAGTNHGRGRTNRR